MRHSQKEIEAMYSQRNIYTVLHAAIRYELDKFLLNWALLAYVKIPEYLDKHYLTGKGEDFVSKNKRIDVLKKHVDQEGLEPLIVAIAAAVLHTHSKQTIQQCVGYLQAYLPHEDSFERAVTAGELLALCSRKKGLYTIKRNGSGKPTIIKVNHWPLIDKRLMDSFDWINDTCFNPPMVVPPKKVTDNRHCGYLTLREPLLLGRLTMHDEDQNYAAINQLNEIEWRLDPMVMAEPEVPAKPLETQEQHEQFSEMVNSSQFVYGLMDNKPFWLCWQYDSRGRMYSHGYHINLQAQEYKKASLSFNKYEVLT